MRCLYQILRSGHSNTMKEETERGLLEMIHMYFSLCPWTFEVMGINAMIWILNIHHGPMWLGLHLMVVIWGSGRNIKGRFSWRKWVTGDMNLRIIWSLVTLLFTFMYPHTLLFCPNTWIQISTGWGIQSCEPKQAFPSSAISTGTLVVVTRKVTNTIFSGLSKY